LVPSPHCWTKVIESGGQKKNRDASISRKIAIAETAETATTAGVPEIAETTATPECLKNSRDYCNTRVPEK
jgi:hypothetical protein